MTEVTKELLWLRMVIELALKIVITAPIEVFEDNQGTIKLANNESNHNDFKTKHMSLKHHFIQREIKIKSIVLKFVLTQNMLADFLTKAVGKTPLQRALHHLHLLCPSRSTNT